MNKKTIYFGFVIILLTFVFYGNSLKNDYSFDDPILFKSVPTASAGLEGFKTIFTSRYNLTDYRPIPVASIYAEVLFLGQANPRLSHFINLLLYIILCIAIYFFLKYLPIPNAHLLAALATLLFLAHPVHSGVVASIKSRDNILSFLFGILALITIQKYVSSRRKMYIFLAGLFIFLGSLCKIDVFVLCLIIPFILFLFYKISIKSILIFMLPLFAIPSVVRLGLLDEIMPLTNTTPDLVRYAENPIVANPTKVYQLGQIFTSIFYYIKFMLIPKDYFFYFGYNKIPLLSFFSPFVLLYMLIVIILTAAAYCSYKKDKIIISFGIIWFFAGISYCINFIAPVSGIIADRYAFIASLGFCVLTGAIAILISDTLSKLLKKTTKQHPKNKKQAAEKKPETPNRPYVAAFITFALLVFYYPYTHSRNADWNTLFTLLEKDMPDLKNSFEANRIASSAYIEIALNTNERSLATDYFKKAAMYANQAIAVYQYKDDIYVNETLAAAQFNLGNYDTCLTICKSNVNLVDTAFASWDMMGDLYFMKRKLDSSVLCYKKILSFSPTYVDAYYKLSNTLAKAGRFEEARLFNDSLIRISPTWFVPFENIGYIKLNQRDTIGSLDYFQKAFELGLHTSSFANTLKNYSQSKGLTEKAIIFGNFARRDSPAKN